MALTSDGIRTFLQNELGVDMAGLNDDAELFSSGMIDSFSLVTLIGYLEEQGGFQMSPMDVNLDNLDTVGRMLAYAASRA